MKAEETEQNGQMDRVRRRKEKKKAKQRKAKKAGNGETGKAFDAQTLCTIVHDVSCPFYRTKTSKGERDVQSQSQEKCRSGGASTTSCIVS